MGDDRVWAFFDWDGVFNVEISVRQARRRHLRRIWVAAADGFAYRHLLHVWLDNAMLREQFPALQPAWATSWWDVVNDRLGNRIGLGPWPSVDLDYYNSDPGLSKLDGILALSGDRPFVWFDDEPRPGDEARLRDLPQPALLVRIDPTQGISPDDLDQAHRWALSLKASSEVAN